MTRFLAVVNSAGGTGKTTTAHALAVAASEYGRRTLLVDFDPASCLTYLLKKENPRRSVTDLLRGDSNLDSVVASSDERFSFLSADSRLARLAGERQVESRERFRSEVAAADPSYDLVILDSASSLSPASTLALSIADYAIATTSGSILSVRGVLQMKELVDSLPKGQRPYWLGALPIQMNPGLRGIAQLLAQDMKVWAPEIAYLKESGAPAREAKSIINVKPSSETAENYREFAYFLLEQIEELDALAEGESH